VGSDLSNLPRMGDVLYIYTFEVKFEPREGPQYHLSELRGRREGVSFVGGRCHYSTFVFLARIARMTRIILNRKGAKDAKIYGFFVGMLNFRMKFNIPNRFAKTTTSCSSCRSCPMVFCLFFVFFVTLCEIALPLCHCSGNRFLVFLCQVRGHGETEAMGGHPFGHREISLLVTQIRKGPLEV
jgi:hypothetical protein